VGALECRAAGLVAAKQSGLAVTAALPGKPDTLLDCAHQHLEIVATRKQRNAAAASSDLDSKMV